MKIYFDIEAPIAEQYIAAARAVVGLEWVDTREEAEGVITDRLVGLNEPQSALFVGDVLQLSAQQANVESGSWLLLGCPWRHEPGIAGIHQSVRRGELGELALLRAHRWLNGVCSESGQSQELVAYLDLALWLFGCQPNQVFANESDPASTLQVHLGFPGNGMGLIDFAWNLSGRGNYDSLHVIGDRGAAYADDHRNQSLLYTGKEPPQALRVEAGHYALTHMLQEFVARGADSESLACLDAMRPAIELVGTIRSSAADSEAYSKQADQFVKVGG